MALVFWPGDKHHLCRLVSCDTGKLIDGLKAHSGPLISASFVPCSTTESGDGNADEGESGVVVIGIVSASVDGDVRIWHPSTSSKPSSNSTSEEGEHDLNYICVHTFNPHLSQILKGEISGMSLHPSHRLVIIVTTAGEWAVLDLKGMEVVYVHHPTPEITNNDDNGGEDDDENGENGGYVSVGCHPDGGIFATLSSDGYVEVWDVLSLSIAFTCPLSHTISVNDGGDNNNNGGVNGGVNGGGVVFSENGYVLASYDSKVVRVWDLRKLQLIREISLHSILSQSDGTEGDETGTETEQGEDEVDGIVSVLFSGSVGEYLQILTRRRLHIYTGKQFSTPLSVHPSSSTTKSLEITKSPRKKKVEKKQEKKGGEYVDMSSLNGDGRVYVLDMDGYILTYTHSSTQ